MPRPDSSILSYTRQFAGLRRLTVARLAGSIQEQVAGGRDFHCRITGDAELRRLNRDFLGHDYATDVLSFPSDDIGGLGDIAISIQRARAQAKEHGHTVEEEIGVLMLHGLLHLLGMDHEVDGGKMARAEVRWRKRLGLPGGLIERAGRRT